MSGTLSMMPDAGDNSRDVTTEDEMEAVYCLYAGLARSMNGDAIGGKLLYAGGVDSVGTRITRAANLAGAATLAASGDGGELRGAMREGVVDFVVNSLDEALRILKNEIRKQQPVAVGVSIAPATLLREMGERGVLPDLLRSGLDDSLEIRGWVQRGAVQVEPQPLPQGSRFNIVAVPQDWKRPAAEFDELLLKCLPPDDVINRRWVRLSSRYLPNAARRLRSVVCEAGRLHALLAGIPLTDS